MQLDVRTTRLLAYAPAPLTFKPAKSHSKRFARASAVALTAKLAGLFHFFARKNTNAHAHVHMWVWPTVFFERVHLLSRGSKSGKKGTGLISSEYSTIYP